MQAISAAYFKAYEEELVKLRGALPGLLTEGADDLICAVSSEIAESMGPAIAETSDAKAGIAEWTRTGLASWRQWHAAYIEAYEEELAEVRAALLLLLTEGADDLERQRWCCGVRSRVC